MDKKKEIVKLEADWSENSTWKGITRGYKAEDVINLRGSINIECTLAETGF
jgi:Isocitrate lyase